MKRHNLFWGSSYDRSLDILLFMWPDIRAQYPDAQLHVCYGWSTFDKLNGANPERMAWKRSMETMMDQKGVIHHGRVGKDKLQEIRKLCGIWTYPTSFPEINCITALDAQADGLVPVTMNDFALKETVGSGIKLDGDIKNPKVQEKYLEELLDLMGNEERWETESKKAKKFSKSYTWANIAQKWTEVFTEPLSTPKVSVITPTIREGWWSMMARNLAGQTYPIHEWIILDDHKEDRSAIAEKYAKAYDLNIKYIRGDKTLGKYKRKYGLVRANNTAWKASEGDLLVFIQDFINIPDTGIESLVDIHRHNPTALIAPVDQYWFAKDPDLTNKEDWWNSNLDFIKGFSWRNIRQEFRGIRTSDNPQDFEMNYGAIPRSTIEALGGWYEFMDEALGYDNAEIAMRAINLGFPIIVDDTNIAMCVDITPITGGNGPQLNTERFRRLAEAIEKDKDFNVRSDERDKLLAEGE